MATAKKKDDTLHMRVEPAQKRLLENAADVLGLTVSAFVLNNALQAARRELEEVRTYSLTLRDAQSFLAALESPPAPNAALKKAFSEVESKYSKSDRRKT